MSEAVTMLSGIYVNDNKAQVSVTIGMSNVQMSTDIARRFVRQILLCIDDAEQFNKDREVNDE